MTTNEFNTVLNICFSPISGCNESRKIGPFTISLSKEKSILMQGRIPYSLLLEIYKKVPSLKYSWNDFSSPELDDALKHFNFFAQFSSMEIDSYNEQYDLYFQEVLNDLIFTGNTFNLVVAKLSISSDPVELFNLLKCIKSYYSE